eukprot:937076-Pyramimonas_sp.AAC.1
MTKRLRRLRLQRGGAAQPSPLPPCGPAPQLDEALRLEYLAQEKAPRPGLPSPKALLHWPHSSPAAQH